MTTISIERLLHWAFVLEIPKGRDGLLIGSAIESSWRLVERVGVLGTLVDGGSGGIHVSSPSPDPDAEAVVAAVAALDDLVLEEGEEHDLLAGWPDFGAVGEAAVQRAWHLITLACPDGRRVLRSQPSALVRRAAILGQWPDWTCEQPRVDVLCGAEGKPRWFVTERQAVWWDEEGRPIRFADMEVDGYDSRRKRPRAGAYRKDVLVPDVSSALARRIEYGITHAALTTLSASLDGIGGRRVLPPDRPAVPWEVVAGGE